MLLANLNVVLVKTRFPENIGMAARACANMGCPEIRLASPERWDRSRAEPLATPKGLAVLDNIKVFDCLPHSVADSNRVFGATARLGGWRKSMLTPWRAASEVVDALERGEKVSLVFGPEDKGLGNEEILICHNLVNIPTAAGASSLNLAQAVLILLYECAKNARKRNDASRQRKNEVAARAITASELGMLELEFKNILLGLDCLHGDNPDYFFIQWHNIFSKASLRRHEFDALMGFCRQLKNKLLHK